MQGVAHFHYSYLTIDYKPARLAMMSQAATPIRLTTDNGQTNGEPVRSLQCPL